MFEGTEYFAENSVKKFQTLSFDKASIHCK